MLAIEGLTVKYGNVRALDSVSLHISEGEIVAVMGANGAGKSTLLKTVSGLIAPASGAVLFRSESLLSMTAPDIVRKGVIHVPEGRRIFPEMTIMENLLVGAYALNRPARQSRERAREVLAMFPELESRQDQIGSQLSGGEQQMLAIARGLMAGPALLMLDEPTMGLAPVILDRISDIIVRLRETGVSIFLAEQNIYFSLDIADRAYVLETSRLVMEGTSSEIAADPGVRSAYLGVDAS
jgi:branched-chain amino acid transport system ATP-binding protein